MLSTENREWGFWGTFNRNWSATEKETQAAWAAAMMDLTAAGYTEQEARAVLDGRLGRHMADQIDNRRQVATIMKDLVVRWSKNVADVVGRNPEADKLKQAKATAAKAKVERTTDLHKKAAINYATAVAGQDTRAIPRRERELRRAAIALTEAIRELGSIR